MYQYALSVLDKFSKPMKAFDKLMSKGVDKVRKLYNANKKLPSSLSDLRAKLELLEDAKERAFSTAEIARYNQKIKETTRSIERLSSTTTRAEKLKNFGRKAFAQPGGEGLALAGGATALLSIREAAKTSDALGDVQRNTSFTRKELLGLEKQLNQIDTRTLASGLLNVAKVGGKIGVPKREMLDFVKVVDQANVGLGDEFNNNAGLVAEKLGVVKNLFKSTKVQTYGKALMSIGSAVNALGKQGKNSAPNLLDFTARVGQLGNLAPSLRQTLAMGAVLEEANISSEIASGGITNIITLLGQRPKKFAKVLELTNAQFKAMFDNNPGNLIGMIAARFNGVKNSALTKLLQGLGAGSQEALKVVNTLSGKTAEYQQRLKTASTQLKKATDLTKDYNIMNNTLAAKLDKAKKAGLGLLVALGRKLAPGVEWLTDKFRKGAKFITKNWALVKPILLGVGIALGAMVLKMLALNAAMFANPVGLVILGVSGLVAILVTAYQKFEPFRKLVKSTWQDLKIFARGVKGDFVTLVNDIREALGGGGAGGTLINFSTIFKLAGLAIRTAISRILFTFRGFTLFFTTLIRAGITKLRFFGKIFQAFFALIRGDVSGAKKHFLKAWKIVGDFFINTFKRIKAYFTDFFKGFIGRVQKALRFVGLLKKENDKALKVQKKVLNNPPDLPKKIIKKGGKSDSKKTPPTLPDFTNTTFKTPLLAGLLDKQGKAGGGVSAIGGKVDSVESSVKSKNVYINFKNFVEGGFHVNSTTIEEGVQKAQDAFMSMFAQVINSVNDDL